MRRVASGILVACGLAVVVVSTACGGAEFTTALTTDGAATTESSRPPADEASAGSDATGDAGVDPGSPPDAGPRPLQDATTPGNGCPAGRGAAMVLVDSICIDSTEATSDEYNGFLLAGPPLAGQPASCSWNASYLPGNGWTFAASQGRLPIAYVNWCDAYAFCSWAGKRLCGKVGGGSATFSQFASNDNEHYLACSNGATRIYPYGNSFDPAACNDIAHDAGHVLPVGSLPACQGGVLTVRYVGERRRMARRLQRRRRARKTRASTGRAPSISAMSRAGPAATSPITTSAAASSPTSGYAAARRRAREPLGCRDRRRAELGLVEPDPEGALGGAKFVTTLGISVNCIRWLLVAVNFGHAESLPPFGSPFAAKRVQ